MIATTNERVSVFWIDIDRVKLGSAAYGSGGDCLIGKELFNERQLP